MANRAALSSIYYIRGMRVGRHPRSVWEPGPSFCVSTTVPLKRRSILGVPNITKSLEVLVYNSAPVRGRF